jgi:TonB family protein
MHAVNRLVVTFLLNASWQIALIAAMGWLCSRLLRNFSSRYVYRLWTACLVLALLAPLLSLFSPAEIVPRILAPQFTATAGPAQPVSASWQAIFLRLLHPEFSLNAWWISALSILYCLFLVACLAWFLNSWRKAKRVRRSAHDYPLPASFEVIAHRCQSALGLKRVPILSSRLVRGPVTAGVRQPVVIVPEFLLTSAGEQEWSSVLAHEFAHIRRRDCFFNLLQQLLCWPISFHPAAIVIKRQISAAREQVCDEMATDGVIDRAAYARSLVSIAGMMPVLGSVPEATYSLGIFDADILEERIMKLLRNNSTSAIGKKAVLAVTVVVLLAFSVSVSAFSFKVSDAGNGALVSLAATASPADEALPLGPGITPPKMLLHVNPSYPVQAKKEKREGTVVVSVVITEKGIPEDVRVTKSAAPDLDENAVAAVRQWKFEPALKDGKPVKVKTRIEVNYHLK